MLIYQRVLEMVCHFPELLSIYVSIDRTPSWGGASWSHPTFTQSTHDHDPCHSFLFQMSLLDVNHPYAWNLWSLVIPNLAPPGWFSTGTHPTLILSRTMSSRPLRAAGRWKIGLRKTWKVFNISFSQPQKIWLLLENSNISCVLRFQLKPEWEWV